MRKKRKIGYDPLGIERAKKALRLQTNIVRGKIQEQIVGARYSAQGYDVKKIHRGADYKVRKPNFITGKFGKTIYVEAKAGKSRFSKAQRKLKKKAGKRYIVERY